MLVIEGAARVRPGGAESFGTRPGRELSVDVIAAPDRVLQDDGRTLACRFDVTDNGEHVPGTIRPGNWMLLPADGSGPLLLGGDLSRALQTEVPARLRAAAGPHALGVAKPAGPVAWTAAGPAVPADGPAPLAVLPHDGSTVDLGGGMAATAARRNGNYSVLVHSRDGDPAQWAHLPDLLLHLPGHVTVAVPYPYRKQDVLTRALDTLLDGGAIPRGRGVLLVMPGAAGTGPDSLAHRLQQRYQQVSEAEPEDRGPVIIAPGGSVARIGAAGDPDADLLTYHEDDDPAQWWKFAPNADPVPLARWLSRGTDLNPPPGPGGAPLRLPIKLRGPSCTRGRSRPVIT